jgi:hypothetical protein
VHSGDAEMSAIIFLCGIACGAIFHRAFAVLRGATLDIQMFRIAELYCLRMLTLCLEDGVFIKEAKYLAMKASPHMGENQAKITKNEDSYLLTQWKEDAIKKMIAIYPPHYKNIIKYSDWKGAMAWLNSNTNKILDNDL